MPTPKLAPVSQNQSLVNSHTHFGSLTENASLEETLHCLRDRLRQLGYFEDDIDTAIALFRSNLNYGVDMNFGISHGVPLREVPIQATIDRMNKKIRVLKEVSTEILAQSKRYRNVNKLLITLSIILAVSLSILVAYFLF